jgi:PadR family transcriptional regulator, regulatory protein PadR
MWPVHRSCPVEHLSELEYLILSTMALAADAYGIAIYSKLRDVVGDKQPVPLTTVYLTLSRLEMKGLCRSYVADELANYGRRPKRRYEVTAEGNVSDQTRSTSLLYRWRSSESIPRTIQSLSGRKAGTC